MLTDNTASQTGKKNYGRRNYVLLILFSLFRFGGDSFFYSFLTRYLKVLNITEHFGDIKLGILISAISFMAVIGNIILAKINDSFKKRKISLVVICVIECVTIIFFGFSNNYWYILIADVICCLCSNPFYNLWDTFILPITSKVNKTYASGRLFGSFFYIIGVLSGGLVISNIGYKYDFIISGSLMLVSLIFFLLLKFTPDDIQEMNREEDVTGEKPTYREVLKNKDFVIYLIAVALLIGSIWSSDSSFALYTVSLNVSDDIFGYSFASAILAEAITMLLMSRFKTISYYKKFMIVASLSIIFRLAVFAIPNMPNAVYLSVEFLRGVTYGLVLSANINLVRWILGPRLLVKGFFLLVALDEFYSGVMNLLIPTIISSVNKATGSENLGYTGSFGVSIFFAVISLLMLVYLFKKRKSPAEPAEIKTEDVKKEA